MKSVEWRCRAIGLLLVLAGAALADQRSYVWTYEYQTVPKNEAELEYYYTASAPDRSSLTTNVTSEHKFEYEIAMNERFDFAIYQVFAQAPGEALTHEEFQLRWRYRFAEKGEHLVDSLLYFEYAGVPDFSEHALETKWVMARDLGPVNVSLNPILECEFGDENETKTEYALGVSYRPNELVRLGVEAKGGKDGHYVGPVISHGKGRFWATLGSAFAVSSVEEGEPEFQTRLLLGIGL